MGLDSDFPQELSGSKKGSGPSAWWFVALGFLVVANLLMWFYPPLKSLSASIFSILSIVVLASSQAFKRYRRIIYAMLVPGLFAWTLVGHGFYWFVTNGDYTGPIADLARWLTGGPYTRAIVAMAIGLLAGILVPMIILEGYLLIHQDVVQMFSGLEVPTVRKILRSLFLNTSRAYFMVKDGEVTKSRPEGLSLIGGPGVVIIAPGNAAVFDNGGKLNRVELSGVHTTQKYERIYKVIRLNSRYNLSASPTPTYPDPSTSPAQTQKPSREGRSVRGLQSKDGIYIDLDLGVFFNIKRKTETPEDSVLAEFTSQKLKDFPEAYFVDKESVFKAATGFNNWELAVSEIAEDVLRNIVGQRNLDQLFGPPSRKELEEILQGSADKEAAQKEINQIRNLPSIRGKICRDIKNEMNKIVNGDGVEVTYVSIGAIDIPEGVREKLQEQWVTEKQQKIVLTRSKTEAEALELIEEARTQVQTQLLHRIRMILEEDTGTQGEYSSRVLLSLRFFEVLRDIASHPSTRPLFPFGIPFNNLDSFRTQLLEEGDIPSEKGKEEPG